MRTLRGIVLIMLTALPCSAAPTTGPAQIEDGDMEQPGRKLWADYGTPLSVAKSNVARAGRQSLRVVTDNKNTMGGNFEGTSRYLGQFNAGDRIGVSVWFFAKEDRPIIIALGQTSFESHQVFSGAGWTRAEVTLRCPRPGRYACWISQVDAATEFYVDDFSLTVQRRASLGEADPADLVELKSEPMSLILCRKTGAIAGIRNNVTGRPATAIGTRWPLLGLELLSADGNSVEPLPYDQLKLKSFDKPKDNQVDLLFATADLPIEIAIRIELAADGEATFSGHIVNNSGRTVLGCEFPLAMDVDMDADPSKLVLVHPDQCGQIVNDAIKSSGCQTTWPGRGVMGWMDLAGQRSGLYLATHDRGACGTRLAAAPASGRTFDLSLTREMVVGPKARLDLPPAVLAIHPGDWHAAADRYRTWARHAFTPTSQPEWLRKSDGWVLVGLQNDMPFAALQDYYRQGQRMGVEFLHVQGQGMDAMSRAAGSDGRYTGQTQMYVFPGTRQGGPEGLKSAVRKIHAAGGHVMFYFVYDRWRPALSTSDDLGTGVRADVPEQFRPPPIAFYRDNGLLETPAGKLPEEHPYSTERLMCLASDGWQQWMKQWAIAYAGYGADGMYWDVMGRNGPFRCFNSAHGHRGQNDWATGSRNVLARTRDECRAVNPDWSCAIEGCSDVLGQFAGFHLMSGATRTPNVFRYTFPDYLCVDGFSNHTFGLTQPAKARRVFLDGERFDLHGYHAEVKRIIDLRRRIKPFIDWPAVFKDTLGLTVSDARVAARSFWRTDGGNRAIAVTMLNEQAVDGASVQLDVSPIGLPWPKAAYLFTLDGQVTPIDLGKSGDRLTILVPKSQVSAALVVSAVSPELAVVPWIEQIRTPGKDGVVVNSFFPLGDKRDVDYSVAWPAGFVPERKDLVLPGTPPYWQQTAFYGSLAKMNSWAKVEAEVRWAGGAAGAGKVWTMLCPPLVNGDFEQAEDGRLVYWPAPPCQDDPGQGKSCIKLDRTTAPNNMIIQVTPLKPGCKYRFRAMVKRTGPQWAGAHVVEYEEGPKFVRSAALNSTRPGQWETLETTFTSHANPRSSAIYLYNYDPGNPVYFDGLELEEVAK